MRIAIAESEPAAADLLMFVAQRRGHQPIAVSSIARLFERLPFEPSVAIVSVPNLDAEAIQDIVRLHRHLPDAALLVIAERTDGAEPIAALKAGADDFLRSPYNPFEVILRAEARASASATTASTGGVRLADLEIDLDAYAATKNGQALSLTKLERRLLYCLCQHHPSVATIDRLLAFGWDSLDEPDAGLLKTHISHIRKKLGDAGGPSLEIVSHQTVGYSLRVAQAAIAG